MARVPTITARHDPLYYPQPHDATITAHVTAPVSYSRNRGKSPGPRDDRLTPIGGIGRIEIWAWIGDITACTELGTVPSVIPCRANAVFHTFSCPEPVGTSAATFPPGTAEVFCNDPLKLSDRQLVTYVANVWTLDGKFAQTEPITFAAGASLTSTPWPGFLASGATFPWEVARPIWWHTALAASWLPQSSSGRVVIGHLLSPTFTAKDRIDVGFFPDPDIPDYHDFADTLRDTEYPDGSGDRQGIVEGAHFNSTSNFSRTYSAFPWLFDLWAGPAGANAVVDDPTTEDFECDQIFGGYAENVAAVTDGEVVIHSRKGRDCATRGPLGKASVSINRADWPGAKTPATIYTHESGHFLFGLADEYCCDGGYEPNSTPANVFGSEDDCKDAATSEGFNPALCVEISGTDTKTGKPKYTGFWRLGSGDSEIMERSIWSSKWRGFSQHAVANTIINCQNGNCFP
jgi:hypothetical protein